MQHLLLGKSSSHQISNSPNGQYSKLDTKGEKKTPDGRVLVETSGRLSLQILSEVGHRTGSFRVDSDPFQDRDAFAARDSAIRATMQQQDPAESPLKPMRPFLGLGTVVGAFPAAIKGEKTVNFAIRVKRKITIFKKEYGVIC